jgi:hypothetical protein
MYVCMFQLRYIIVFNVICGHVMAEVSCCPITAGNGFNPKPAHVGFVVDKVTLGQVFLEYFSFPLSFHQCSTFIHLPLTIYNATYDSLIK